MRPPFTLTPRILNLASEINRLLGNFEGLHAPLPQPKLRRLNQIRAIQGSLAIEGNTLNLDQVTAILDNKKVVGPKKEILEVQNALHLYEYWNNFGPSSKKDLLKAHAILMKDLTPTSGKFRTGSVGILKGSLVSHIAPPAIRVSGLIEDLLTFLKQDKELSPLIKACIFHYEFEFIHPFTDGNGRLGRFWQHLILAKFHPAFVYAPVESFVKERQKEYYKALEKSDQQGESTFFIEFSLQGILETLSELLDALAPEIETPESRLRLVREKFGSNEFGRKDYLRFFKKISTATASRDLALGVSNKTLSKSGTKALTRYRFCVV